MVIKLKIFKEQMNILWYYIRMDLFMLLGKMIKIKWDKLIKKENLLEHLSLLKIFHSKFLNLNVLII